MEKLHQVLLNILDNALFVIERSDTQNKFIAIKTEQEKDMALIELSNSGSHIDEDKLSSIFDPFFTTKDPGEGVGLGLAISYQLIKDHNGTLEAKNTHDGVSFLIRIPLKN